VIALPSTGKAQPMDRFRSQHLGRILAALFVVWGAGSARAEPDDPDFEKLLAAAQEDPSRADFKRLRLAYGRSPAYNPYRERFDPGPVQQEVENGERVAGLLALDRALEDRWMDLDAHRYAAVACRRLGEVERAERHEAFHRGLLEAILDAGDGRGFDTAWPVLGVGEEYHVIRVLGLESKSQALVEHDGHSFDVLTVKDPRTSDTFDVYFNIDAPLSWLRERLEKLREKDKSHERDSP
jgi:hypothetical protein